MKNLSVTVLLLINSGVMCMQQNTNVLNTDDRLSMQFTDLDPLWKKAKEAPFPLLTCEQMRACSDTEKKKLCMNLDWCGAFYLQLDDTAQQNMAQLWEQTQHFFACSEEEKKGFMKEGDLVGYSSFAKESTARATGTEGGNDLCEKFTYRLGVPGVFPDDEMRETWECGAETLAELKQEVVGFLGHLCGADKATVEGWKAATQNAGLLRFLRYPDASHGEGESPIRMGEHCDITVCTLAFQTPSKNGLSSLEVKEKQGEWLPVPAIAGTVIVFIGELLRYLTNGAANSVPHRVVTPPLERHEGSARESLLFFGYPDETLKFKTMPGIFDRIHQAAQKEGKDEITYREFIRFFSEGGKGIRSDVEHVTSEDDA